MATFFDDVYKDAKAAWAEIADYMPLISNGSGKINDVNKKASDNTVNMYAVVSENVPASVRAIIAKNLKIKYLAALMVILKNTILKDPTKANTFFKDRLSNTDKTTKLQGHVDSVIGSTMVEALMERMQEVPQDEEIVLNESNLSEARRVLGAQMNFRPKMQGDKFTSMNTAKNSSKNGPSDFSRKIADTDNFNHAVSKKHAEDLEYIASVEDAKKAAMADKQALNTVKAVSNLEDKQNKLIMASMNLRNGTGNTGLSSTSFGGLNKSDYLEFPELVIAGFTVLDGDLRPHIIEISFNVNVKMMEIESQKIKDVIISTKERDTFFQYLKYRAGASHFFKDFILNLKEIEKEVERNTNQTLANRILTDMVRTSGLLAPKILGDLNETRHYSLILDKSDVDDLRRNSKIDIESRGPLLRIFEKLCILNLIICNPDRSELTFYDSSDPAKYDVKNYAKITSDDDLLKRFVMSMK
jgi:hypothetical protein